MFDQKHNLVRAVRTVYEHHRTEIDDLKREGELLWMAPDFIWEQLLRSFSTMGNARGMRLMRDPVLHDRVTYRAVVDLTPAERRTVLMGALAAASVRMAACKTGWLCSNFDRIQLDGGPDAVKTTLSWCNGRNAKIAYLKTFHGIGDKYARKVMMDAYHSEFRDSIAFDVRLKKIADALPFAYNGYTDAERFFLGVATSAGLNGWELDRLLYHATDEILLAIRATQLAS
jgi:hypothetical protein